MYSDSLGFKHLTRACCSVLQSGWEDIYKRHFLGERYGDMRETNVPIIRLRSVIVFYEILRSMLFSSNTYIYTLNLRFRQETLDDEINYIKKTANLHS